MNDRNKISAEELLDQRELKPLINWETYQELISEYPHLEEELLILTETPQ